MTMNFNSNVRIRYRLINQMFLEIKCPHAILIKLVGHIRHNIKAYVYNYFYD